jgi:hypothetical protein
MKLHNHHGDGWVKHFLTRLDKMASACEKDGDPQLAEMAGQAREVRVQVADVRQRKVEAQAAMKNATLELDDLITNAIHAHQRMAAFIHAKYGFYDTEKLTPFDLRARKRRHRPYKARAKNT